MKILKFELSGTFAYFKNPEANSVYFFTYNNIHRVALLGILGSILGLKGYNQQGNADYPEFYEKLKDLKIAIVPRSPVCPNKKIQEFNNSTMFNNIGGDKRGANLIVKEEWIESPCWDIYIKIGEDKLEQELADRVMNRRFVYVPYLGKNDHFANITKVRLFNSDEIEKIESETFRLDSFYKTDSFEDVNLGGMMFAEIPNKYREYLPFELTNGTNLYVTKSISHSSGELKLINSDNDDMFTIDNMNISFL